PLHGLLQPARTAVVRGECQMPVAVEQVAEGLEVAGCRLRCLFRVRSLLDVPVAAQPVFERRASHELPDALGLGSRERIRLEGALYPPAVRQTDGHAFSREERLY